MIEKLTQSRILIEFDKAHGAYGDYARTVCDLVKQMLAASGVTVHSVTSRCKQRQSLSRKLSLPDKAYQALTDITDIAAIRITTYFSDDVDVIAELIEKEFMVVSDQSVDKRVTLDPDRFGYQSLHYVANLAAARCELIEYQRFSGLKIEIQIRSILQHAWAEIEHDLGYKSASGIPRDVRRRFARVAGLLELADAEFASIRKSLEDYEGSVASEIQQDPAKVELDLLSLRALYTIDSNVKALDLIVVELMGRDLNSKPEAVREAFVERFAELGIHRIDELEEAAERERDTLKRFTKYWLTRKSSSFEPDETDETVDAGVGVFYLLYVLIWRKKDRKFAIKYFESNSIGNEEDREWIVDELMSFV